MALMVKNANRDCLILILAMSAPVLATKKLMVCMPVAWSSVTVP